MRRFALALLALALAWAGAACEPARTDSRPNVLIVVTDDERIESEQATPKLYGWFSEGTIFERAYVTTPHCCPSRASIFTGRYVHNHKVTSPAKISDLDHSRTLQHEVSRAGYATGFAGKFLNGWPLREAPPHFDRWSLGEGYTDAVFYEQGVRRVVDYGPTYVFEQARAWIDDWEARDAEPWMLMLSPSTPHEPAVPEPEYADEEFEWKGNPASASTDLGDKPRYVRRQRYGEALGTAIRESQLRTLRSVDDAFMATIDHLERRGELDRTLVIYLSDNGYMWAEHGMIGKGVPYQPAVRVPMYMRGPGVDARSQDAIVANIDLAPTVYRAAGIQPSYTVDGRPLFDVERDALLLEYAGGRDVPAWWSLVTRDDQYTEYDDGFREYYDLARDPHQLQNQPERATAEHVRALHEAMGCEGSGCP